MRRSAGRLPQAESYVVAPGQKRSSAAGMGASPPRGEAAGMVRDQGAAMDVYPAIADHGLIGDLQTSALVSTDATIDWFCCPRFDSPSVFASLLDVQRGGHFSIRPQTDGYVTKQLYLPDTAILMTRFLTPDGVGEVCYFMPVITGEATDRHQLVRLLCGGQGERRLGL